MPLVFKGTAHDAGGRGAVLPHGLEDRSLRQARGGVRRQHDGGHHHDETLCDAEPGAMTHATAQSGGPSGYFTFRPGGGINCGLISIAAIDWRP